MRSTSTLAITWVRPDITVEEWEFSSHPAKQEFFRRNGISWDMILASFERGSIVPWPRSGSLAGIPVEGSHHSYDDYSRYLSRAKRNYRINYSRMEEDLQRAGELTLPAPIVLQCNGEALLFAGWRRLCLAWNNGMAPGVWLVPITGGVPCA